MLRSMSAAKNDSLKLIKSNEDRLGYEATPPHLPQFSIVDELRAVSMDECTESQTVFPAETEKLAMKQKQLETKQRLFKRFFLRRTEVGAHLSGYRRKITCLNSLRP